MKKQKINKIKPAKTGKRKSEITTRRNNVNNFIIEALATVSRCMYFGHVYHNSRTTCCSLTAKNCLLVVVAVAAVYTNEYNIFLPTNIHTWRDILNLHSINHTADSQTLRGKSLHTHAYKYLFSFQNYCWKLLVTLAVLFMQHKYVCKHVFGKCTSIRKKHVSRFSLYTCHHIRLAVIIIQLNDSERIRHTEHEQSWTSWTECWTNLNSLKSVRTSSIHYCSALFITFK